MHAAWEYFSLTESWILKLTKRVGAYYVHDRRGTAKPWTAVGLWNGRREEHRFEFGLDALLWCEEWVLRHSVKSSWERLLAEDEASMLSDRCSEVL